MLCNDICSLRYPVLEKTSKIFKGTRKKHVNRITSCHLSKLHKTSQWKGFYCVIANIAVTIRVKNLDTWLQILKISNIMSLCLFSCLPFDLIQIEVLSLIFRNVSKWAWRRVLSSLNELKREEISLMNNKDFFYLKYIYHYS